MFTSHTTHLHKFEFIYGPVHAQAEVKLQDQKVKGVIAHNGRLFFCSRFHSSLVIVFSRPSFGSMAGGWKVADLPNINYPFLTKICHNLSNM